MKEQRLLAEAEERVIHEWSMLVIKFWAGMLALAFIIRAF